MKRIAYILAAVLTLAACAKETIHHPSEAEAPQTASVYEPVITVDQETNQVTFSVDAKGIIPVWLFYDNKTEDFTVRYARNGLQRIFTAAGDYKVRMQVMNASGVTPDYVERIFHVDNTLVDFDKYIKLLVGSGDRVWRINNKVAAHQACGESIENPTGWWAASADEKAGTGLYDNRVTFSAEGEYTFDPGEAGTVYVNAGVTAAPYAEEGHSEDYQVAVAQTTAEYSFSVEGDYVYLTLPAGTPFPYIPNNDFVSDPRFIIQKISAKELVLVWYTATGNGGGPIAWQFILTSEAGEVKFKGFNYNADSNLWKGADAANTVGFWYAPGWAQIADPDMIQNGAEYTLTLPEATSDQWQAQFTITPTEPLVLTADKSYDFSVIVNTDTELPGMTLKLTDVGDDNNYLFVERVKFPAGETVYYLTDLAGIDAPNGVKMVFDFGGNAANTEVSVANIVVKDHAIDDGTVLPDEGEEEKPEEGAHYDITGATNFWRSMHYQMSFYTAHTGEWKELPATGFDADDVNFVYQLTMPEETHNQWQRQVAFHTDMTSSADKKYDFCATITADSDINGVTIKLVKEGDDNTFYFADRHNLKAGEPYVYKVPNMDGIDMEAITLVFDFGGNPANAAAEIKDICFQEHQDPQGGAAPFDYDADTNLWKPADAAHTYSQYYAPGWSQLPNPEVTNNGNVYSFSCPSATTDQWQNQFFIIPTDAIALSADKHYDFQCKVEVSENVKGVTFKLTDSSSDDNFLFTERRDLTGYEPFTFTLTDLAGIDAAAVKMVFDFGGNPANTDVTISEIILREHE